MNKETNTIILKLFFSREAINLRLGILSPPDGQKNLSPNKNNSMVRIKVSQGKPITKEELQAIQAITIQRIRALSGEEAKALLEELMAKHEITGILFHSREFIDRLVMEKISLT